MGMQRITEKALAGERITIDEGLALLENADLFQLGFLANAIRRQKHPEPVVTYVIDRNINYTDICISACKFCAFFKTPEDPAGSLLSFEELGKKIKETKFPSKMGAPDISAGKNARAFGKRLKIGTVIVDKDRQPNETTTTVMEVIGDPNGCDIYFFDDMIASAGSCKNAAIEVRNKGARDVYMIASHLVYSEKTWLNLIAADFKEIWVTETRPIPAEKILTNMRVFTVAEYIAQIIDNAHNGMSVSDLWHNNGH